MMKKGKVLGTIKSKLNANIGYRKVTKQGTISEWRDDDQRLMIAVIT